MQIKTNKTKEEHQGQYLVLIQYVLHHVCDVGSNETLGVLLRKASTASSEAIEIGHQSVTILATVGRTTHLDESQHNNV